MIDRFKIDGMTPFGPHDPRSMVGRKRFPQGTGQGDQFDQPGFGGPSGGGGGGGPPPPPEDDPIGDAQRDFLERLKAENPAFFEEAKSLLERSRGIDPLFDQAQNNLLGVLDNQRQRALGQTSNFFERRGAGSGTAALNAQQRQSGLFDERGIELSTQLQFAGLERSDALRGESFDLLSSGLTNESIPLQLLIAELNARNAGTKPSGGGGGCTILCLVLTDELLSRGDLTMEEYAGNRVFARARTDPELYAGYRMWAAPLVRLMRRSDVVYRLVRFLVRRYVEQTCYYAGRGGRPNWIGKSLAAVIWPGSRVVYRVSQWLGSPPALDFKGCVGLMKAI